MAELVDRARLEIECTARYRGFESHSLRNLDFELLNLQILIMYLFAIHWLRYIAATDLDLVDKLAISE